MNRVLFSWESVVLRLFLGGLHCRKVEAYSKPRKRTTLPLNPEHSQEVGANQLGFEQDPSVREGGVEPHLRHTRIEFDMSNMISGLDLSNMNCVDHRRQT